MNAPPDLKITRDYVIFQPKTQGVYPIQETDWARLKRLITSVVPGSRLLEVLSSLSFGVFASSLLSLVAFASATGLAAWVLPTTWSISVASLILGVALELLHRQQVRVTVASVEVVLQEMTALEHDFQTPPQVDGSA